MEVLTVDFVAAASHVNAAGLVDERLIHILIYLLVEDTIFERDLILLSVFEDLVDSFLVSVNKIHGEIRVATVASDSFSNVGNAS